MRLLCEIFVIGGLLYLGWDIPFRDRLPAPAGSHRHAVTAPATATAASAKVPLQPFVQSTPVRIVTVQPQPAASVSGSWMFDPNHRTALDRPAYDTRYSQEHYLDPQGRSYWYDSKGVRHYDQQ